MSRNTRIGVLIAVVVAAVAAFLIARPGRDRQPSNTGVIPTTTATTPRPPAVPRIVVRNGRPVGGVRKIRVEHGEPVRFVVSSDVADEVHVHGYDLKRDVRPGRSISFRFPARIEGVFEVELESRKVQIAELRVTP